MEQFRTRLQRTVAAARAPVGRPITPDQAQALRLEQRTLGQMIASAALDDARGQSGSAISDAEVVKQIT